MGWIASAKSARTSSCVRGGSPTSGAITPTRSQYRRTRVSAGLSGSSRYGKYKAASGTGGVSRRQPDRRKKQRRSRDGTRAGDSKLRAASEASRSSRKPNPTGRRVDQSDDAERAACSRHGELIAAFRCTALLRFALRDTRSVTRRDAHARRKQQRQHQRHCDDSAASGKLSAALRNVAERALTWLETG
jgi:hypothetical protein